MRSQEVPQLGALELQILNLLWERGEATVREVLEALPREGRPAYTTVLTVTRLMYEKGYLTRRERGRAHLYRPVLQERRVKRGMLRHLISAAFRGSREALLVRLFEDERLTREELDRVRQLIAEKESEG